MAVSLTWISFGFWEAFNAPRWIGRPNAIDLIGNVVLLFPLGMAVAMLWTGPGVVTAALGVGLLLSAIIEGGQLVLPDRIPSVLDLVLNSTGAGLGAIAAAWWSSSHGSALRLLAALGVASYIVVLGTLANSAWALRQEMRLEAWTGEFEIAAGGEIGADRHYVGDVRDAYICAGPRKTRVCAEPGASRELRDRVARAAEASQMVELGARVRSLSDEQIGPTRIVTFSQGGFLRNATVGQEGNALVVRFRTLLMGPNGDRYELHFPDALHEGEPLQISVLFDRGTVTAMIAGSDGARSTSQRFDVLAGGLLWRDRGPVTPTQNRGVRFWAVLVLVQFPGTVLACRLRRRQHPPL